MSPKIITISLLMLTSCHPKTEATSQPVEATPELQPESQPESQPEEAPPESAPVEVLKEKPQESATPISGIAVADLPKYIGKTITLQGKLTEKAAHHEFAPPAGTKHDYFFNIEQSQLVLYTEQDISCGTTLEVAGTVLEVPGPVNRAGKPMSMEYHLKVSSWKCIP